MDANEFIEMDLQLGEALADIRRLREQLAERDRRIEELQGLFQEIIKAAQQSYSCGAKGDGRLPAAGAREVSKEAF